jgi:acyl-CoA thioesterase FadM
MQSGPAFVFEHDVFFHETSGMGGVVYFSNYVKWQGMVREAYFIRQVPAWAELIKAAGEGRLNMITVEEHSHFKRHSFFGDRITILLYTANIQKCSFDMIFRMYRNNVDEIIYEGWQKLTFDDCKGNFIAIPDSMLEAIGRFEINMSEYFRKYGVKDARLSERKDQ